jgi:hypothetical protein
VKGAQRDFIEAEIRVLGNVTTSAERPALAPHDHAAHVVPRLQRLEHRAQLAPHRPRHGVELARVRQRDGGERAVYLQQDLSSHGVLRADRLNRSGHRPPL